jgi:uncharacterized OB-fold protein
MAMPLKKPQLYRPAAGYDAQAGSPASLNAVKCTCGHVAFPPQSYGCEQCGRNGSDLQETVLSGQGRLLASSTVHMHAAAYPVAPFTVVEVELDHGVVTRSLLADGQATDLKPGTLLRSVLQAEPAEGGDVLDLRFVIAN